MLEPDHERPTVVVIDDDVAVREALAALFQSVGLESRIFPTVDDFLAAGLVESSACLVLDVRLPGRSGLEFQTELSKIRSDLPIVFISGHADVPISVRAMKSGAIDFLIKPVREQDLLDAVQSALSRDKAAREGRTGTEALRSRYAELSEREREVMIAVAEGARNKEVAARLGITEATVKLHRGNVMSKMGAKSVQELVRMADRLESN